jgi:hypothetical protein
MNASTVAQTGQALPYSPAPVQHLLLLTEFSQIKENRLFDNMDVEKIALRATKITVVLKDIMEHSGYRHGGLNE